jgi:hypothetical protein
MELRRGFGRSWSIHKIQEFRSAGFSVFGEGLDVAESGVSSLYDLENFHRLLSGNCNETKADVAISACGR